MFLSLDAAQKIDPSFTQDDVDALELIVRGLTNNHFHVDVTKRHFLHKGLNLYFRSDNIVLPINASGAPLQGTTDFLKYIKVGDTIEVYGTGVNDGVFDVVELEPKIDPSDPLPTEYIIRVRLPEGFEFVSDSFDGSLVKVHYPLDVVGGVKKLIEYDFNMQGRVGIKSETVSRLTVTYFDMTAAESENAYPRSLTNFLARYRRFDWGN